MSKINRIVFFNLGSGNLSICIISIEDGLHIIKAVNNNINLEGDDFDNRLIIFVIISFTLFFK